MLKTVALPTENKEPDMRSAVSSSGVVVDLAGVDPIRCPCGWARRALGGVPNSPLSLHQVDIELDAAVHHHDHHTEVYYILQAEPEAKIELDGELLPIKVGQCIYIPPGVKHRAVGKMRILNIVLPPFDPADEHLD
jgi:mannose-6-phosphate isomerase-like protein (cupin superfamily)